MFRSFSVASPSRPSPRLTSNLIGRPGSGVPSFLCAITVNGIGRTLFIGEFCALPSTINIRTPARSGSRLTSIVAEAEFPARSIATAVMVLVPADNGISGRKKVLFFTAADSPLIVTETSSSFIEDPGIISLTVPATEIVSVINRSPSVGDSITTSGGAVSTLTEIASDPILPTKSIAVTTRLLVPSKRSRVAVQFMPSNDAAIPLIVTCCYYVCLHL